MKRSLMLKNQELVGFEDRILETYAPNKDLPANFATLVAQFFSIQREYVNKTVESSKILTKE